MSQAKVEKKKELKKNRKKIIRREHREVRLLIFAGVLVLIVLAFWVVFSVQKKVEKYHEENPKTVTVDLSDIVSFQPDAEDKDENKDK